MEYQDKIKISPKEVKYVGVPISRQDNSDFIKVNGDIENIIHSDDKAAYNLLKRLKLENLAPGVIVAGEFTKQKTLCFPEINGIPYIFKTAFKSPLVVDDRVYVNYSIKEIAFEPKFHPYSHHYKFEVDNQGRLIMKGEIITIEDILWSLDGKQSEKLDGDVLSLADEHITKDKIDNFYKVLDGKVASRTSMIASSYIPPKLLKPIRDSVNEKLGIDEERQYMLNSQNLTCYRKEIDLNEPLTFEYTKPVVKERGGINFCNTTLHIKSNEQRVIECIILGAGI